VRLDSPYLPQIASIRKMPKNAIACRTSIRRFKRANYQLIEQLNFVGSYSSTEKNLKKKKRYSSTRSRISVLKLYTHSLNLYTHSVKLYTHRTRSTGTAVPTGEGRYEGGFAS
jgi:hypothetical protein